MESIELVEQIRDLIAPQRKAKNNLVPIIRGATATGKSSLSIALAEYFPIEIISADSRQIYRGMDIGTDKVDKEIRNCIPHHMIDIVAPDEIYTAGEWKQDVLKLITEIQARGNLPIIVGGTGLYIDMLYKNYAMPDLPSQRARREEMEAHEKASPGRLHAQLVEKDPTESYKHHPNSIRYILRALEIVTFTGQTKTELTREQPVDFPICMLGLRREKEDTNGRINSRIKQMIDAGLLEEVEHLLSLGYTLTHPSMQGIGYKEIVLYLQHEYTREKAIEFLKCNSHRYAKRQRSRFRRYIIDSKTAPKHEVSYHVFTLS